MPGSEYRGTPSECVFILGSAQSELHSISSVAYRFNKACTFQYDLIKKKKLLALWKSPTFSSSGWTSDSRSGWLGVALWPVHFLVSADLFQVTLHKLCSFCRVTVVWHSRLSWRRIQSSNSSQLWIIGASQTADSTLILLSVFSCVYLCVSVHSFWREMKFIYKSGSKYEHSW